MAPARLASAKLTAGTRCQLPLPSRASFQTRRSVVFGPDDDGGDILDVNRTIVAGVISSRPMSGMPDSVCPAATLRTIPASRTWPARNERLASCTLPSSCCSVTPKSDSFSGSGSTLICSGGAAGDVGQADVVDLHQLGAQLVGEFVEILVRPAVGGFGFR